MTEPLDASGKKLERGVKMPPGKGWRLVTPGKKNKETQGVIVENVLLGK
jgi:hypothetical protein